MTLEDTTYYDNLPKKRMAVGVLFFNKAGKLLVVKPTYKDHWSVPGGVVDADESLRQACIREVKEELNLEIKDVKLLCVDYMLAAASEYKNKTENLQFIFWGGTLELKQIKSIKLPKEELSEYKFGKIEEVLPLLGHNLKKRIPECLRALKANTAVYLENGEKPAENL